MTLEDIEAKYVEATKPDALQTLMGEMGQKFGPLEDPALVAMWGAPDAPETDELTAWLESADRLSIFHAPDAPVAPRDKETSSDDA